MLLNITLVGFGGALGAVSRFGINEIIYKNFSFISLYSNLVINIIGCFLVGFIIGATIPVKDSSYYFFIMLTVILTIFATFIGAWITK